MDIKEILERPSPAVYTLEEIGFAIEEYIYKKKNVRVKVNPHKNFLDIANLNPWGQLMLQKEYQQMFGAFQTVQENYNK